MDITCILTKFALQQAFNALMNNIKGDKYATLISDLSNLIDVHHAMIEDMYLSPLRTFMDYVKLKDYKAAASSIMELSNRQGTPFVNFLLCATLIEINEYDLAYEKYIKAISGNPNLAENGCFKEQSMVRNNIPIEWKCKPHLLDNKFSYKIQRKLGFPIDEGVSRMEIDTFAGNIVYKLLSNDIEECEIGVIELVTGKVLWAKKIHYDNSSKIEICSIDYIVIRYQDCYHIYNSRTGKEVAAFSGEAYNALFCPSCFSSNQAVQSFKFETSMEGNYYIPIHSDKKLKVTLFPENHHFEIYSTGGRTNVEMHKRVYDANNVIFSIQ